MPHCTIIDNQRQCSGIVNLADVQAQALERQANALLKFAMLAKKDIRQGRGMTEEETRQKLREARK